MVVTRQNVTQLDAFQALADRFGAQLRLTRLRPSGRGADVWDELHPTADQQRLLYDWLTERGEQVLTGDSFFHLAGYGGALPGLNLCGAGRVVCLIDPVGDVYACPFAIHDASWRAMCSAPGGFAAVWRDSELFADLRRPQTGGACESCSAYDSCRAAAWRPSSSPACRWTARTPSASVATARPRWPRRAGRTVPPARPATTRTGPRRARASRSRDHRPPPAGHRQRVHGPPAPTRPRLRRKPAGRLRPGGP